MRRAKKLAAGIAAAMVVSAISAPVSYAADNAFGIDELNWTDQDWASIAMTNDDTVDTGVIIRTEADKDSKAAGYLYRGAGVQVVDKGEEWTEVRSGRVEGYVKNEFLAFGDEARGLAAHYGQQGIIANWNDVNVFSDNNADSPVATKLEDGAPMSMLEDNGHWITVQHGADSAGFVSEEDVTRVLLVDTAVPAEGEDVADVPATMTAADAQALTAETRKKAVASYAEYTEAVGEAAESSGDTSSEEASSAETSSGEASSAETSSGEASSETTLTVAAASEESYSDASASESSYTDTSASETAYTDSSASESTYTADSSSASAQDYSQTQTTEASSAQTYSTQTVSDNSDIQALYDAYITAQNAAMDCTSEADAQTKADAAIAAWNAYLAACGETSASASGSTYSEPAASESTYTDTTASSSTAAESASSASESTSTAASESASSDDTSAAAQTEAAASTQSSSSSGGSAYGNYSDLDLLAAIIWCEAGNQPYDGMVAVGQVVMNRVASSSFPNSVSEVLNQPGQFTPASAGTLQAALASGVNSTCYSAAQDAMNGAAPVPGYPLYFNTHSGSYQLGAHYFS